MFWFSYCMLVVLYVLWLSLLVCLVVVCEEF